MANPPYRLSKISEKTGVPFTLIIDLYLALLKEPDKALKIKENPIMTPEAYSKVEALVNKVKNRA